MLELHSFLDGGSIPKIFTLWTSVLFFEHGLVFRMLCHFSLRPSNDDAYKKNYYFVGLLGTWWECTLHCFR